MSVGILIFHGFTSGIFGASGLLGTEHVIEFSILYNIFAKAASSSIGKSISPLAKASLNASIISFESSQVTRPFLNKFTLTVSRSSQILLNFEKFSITSQKVGISFTML